MPHHPPRVLQILAELERHGPFESRMQFAIAAAEILLGSIVLPVRRRMHLVERLVVPVRNQVARPLPSARIARDCSPRAALHVAFADRSEDHTSELQSRSDLVCRLLLEKKKKIKPPVGTANLIPVCYGCPRPATSV